MTTFEWIIAVGFGGFAVFNLGGLAWLIYEFRNAPEGDEDEVPHWPCRDANVIPFKRDRL